MSLLLPQCSLTLGARQAIQQLQQDDVQALMQIASELTLPDQHEKTARADKKRAFQQLFAKVSASMRQFEQENGALQKAIDETELGIREMETSLRAELKRATDAASAVKERSQMQEKQHQVAMAILEKQLNMVEGFSRELSSEVTTLKEEKRKLEFNENLLKEILKCNYYGAFLDPRVVPLASTVNMAYTQMKQ